MNLVGRHHDEVGRGEALVHPGRWHATRLFDASLGVLAALDHEVSRRGAYVAYLGSGELPGRLRVLGTGRAGARGESGWSACTCPEALPLLPGDRFVLREPGRGETVGGGEVLDVDPVLPVSKAAPDRSVDRVVAERGWVEADMLERLTGERRAPTIGPVGRRPGRWRRPGRGCGRRSRRPGPWASTWPRLDERDRAVLAVLGRRGRRRRPGLAGPAPDPLADHP